MSSGKKIDYFYVETEFADDQGQCVHLDRTRQHHRQLLRVENSGHFPADVGLFCAIPHQSTGITFAAGVSRVVLPDVVDLKPTERADRDVAIDPAAASSGSESWRTGIVDYRDRSTQKRTPAVDPPLIFSMLIR